MKRFDRPFTVMEAERLGVSRQALSAFVGKGTLERICPGIYCNKEMVMSEDFSLQVAALKVPSAIVCLLSALRFHGLTTQNPHELYLAVPAHHWIPCEFPIALRTFSMSGSAFSFGIETHDRDGVAVRVYSPAKTVADLFKFRNKIGTDIALEALREGFRQRKFTASELMKAAAVCRVANIIRPYAESVLS